MTLGTTARARVVQALRAVDAAAGRIGSRWAPGGTVAFLFHGLFADRDEVERGGMAPHERLTVEDLHRLLDRLCSDGVRFITLEELAAGPPPGERRALLTFDDGYANNLRLLEVLPEYDVPATVFVATRFVQEGKPFWWDVLHRERRRRGQERRVEAESFTLLRKRHAEIHHHLEEQFGAAAARAVDERARPLRPDELSRLAAHPLITLANHTSDHAVLPNHSYEEMEAQITDAQRYLQAVTARPARALSFPHGLYDRTVISAARCCGMETLFSLEARPIASGHARARTYGRFVLDCRLDLDPQLAACGSPLGLTYRVQRAVHGGRWLRRAIG